MANCESLPIGRRLKFWATQEVGTNQSNCGDDCASFGLNLVKSGEYASISTDDWVRGLAINILMTDGRKPNTICGYRAGNRGGHWSDSFRSDGLTSGSLVRTIKASGKIRDQVNLLQAYAQSDMEKLVTMGVAISVNVTANYIGGNRASLDIEIIGPSGTTANVAVSGTRISNAWVWQ